MIIDIRLLGSAIRDFRKGHDMTQSELAEIADVTANTIARIERGELKSSIKTIESIASAFGIPASFLTLLATTKEGTEVDTLVDALKVAVNQFVNQRQVP